MLTLKISFYLCPRTGEKNVAQGPDNGWKLLKKLKINYVKTKFPPDRTRVHIFLLNWNNGNIGGDQRKSILKRISNSVNCVLYVYNGAETMCDKGSHCGEPPLLSPGHPVFDLSNHSARISIDFSALNSRSMGIKILTMSTNFAVGFHSGHPRHT